jgi:hypothetical protein
MKFASILKIKSQKQQTMDGGIKSKHPSGMD